VALELLHPQGTEEWAEARRLIEEYAASLGVDLSFQNIAHELDHLASEYGPPTGSFLLAYRDGSPVGCAGVRRFSPDAGELKRLYVVDRERGRGTGRLLAREIIAAAKRLGYSRLLLDTLPSMRDAQRLYRSLGFRPTSAYRHNPIAGTAFFELKL
jgi:GNAT superfamily N-acetyltransferase